MASAFEKFLGLARWQALGRAWIDATNQEVRSRIGLDALFLYSTLALLPVLAILVAASIESIPAYGPTLVFGVCTVVAVMLRRRLNAPGIASKVSWQQLSLTHTAVALGCIPAVLLLIFDPSVLAERQTVINEAVSGEGGEAGQRMQPLMIIGFSVFVALWVAVTEEVLFRGILLSAIRRSRMFRVQRRADTFAILVSALVFGLAHVPQWGWVPGIALFGLGCGFGIAYVVTGEQLAPVIGYHFVFDLLSISLVLLL